MDTHVIDSLVGDVVAAIVDDADCERVILFGSAAKGGVGPDSDLDLVVVEKETAFRGGSRGVERSLIRRALQRFLVPIDLFLFTPEEMAKWKGAVNHVIAHSQREGLVVYDRTLCFKRPNP
jgi:uncharacterized protein